MAAADGVETTTAVSGSVVAAAAAVAVVSASVNEDANVVRVDDVADVLEERLFESSARVELIGEKRRWKLPLESGPSKPIVFAILSFFVETGYETG